MDMFVVRGGRPLCGVVEIGGAKNAALPIMAASIAVGGTTTLFGIPQLADVQILSELLSRLGVRTQPGPDGAMTLTTIDESACTAGDDLVRKMRASVCVLGPLLGRRRRACVSLPGGCQIGHRPIDVHLRGLSALGAEITLERGYIFASAKKLRGTTISLATPSGSTVTGTCNVMTAACLAEGRTVLLQAAMEPEVVDLGHFLNACGARISGLGTPTIEIIGVSELQGTCHEVIPDRIEAATLMIAAGMTHGQLQLQHLRLEHLSAAVNCLRRIGLNIEADGPHVVAAAGSRWSPVDLRAEPYPGLPTDIQAQLTSLLSLVPGRSRLVDRVFPDRFLHLPELSRMGADVCRIAGGCEVRGVKRLSSASVVATDLRAGAALLLAALSAEGDSAIRRVDYLDRGYEQLECKLTAVGADVRRVPDDHAYEPESLIPRFDEMPSVAFTGPHWSCQIDSGLVIPGESKRSN